MKIKKYDENSKKITKNSENKQKNENKVNFSEEKSQKNNKGMKGAIIGLAISCGVLGLTTLGLGIGYAVTQSQASTYGTQLENVYERNYYDLVSNINNADMKVSKILNTSSSNMQKKYLQELSENAKEAQSAISTLPLTSSEMENTVRFINQLSGYTATLAEKTSKGLALSANEMESLAKIHENLTSLKENINNFSKRLENGYKILSQTKVVDGNNAFTTDMSKIKDVSVEVPTMIYDGPFSDSTINKKVNGLSGDRVSREKCFASIEKLYKNIKSLDYMNDTNGLFETYNFKLTNTDDEHCYIQITKIGGHVLTISGDVKSQNAKISEEEAIKIAQKFAGENGIEKTECVWSQTLKNQMYLNLAPTENGIVLYPDLVKVKVDLESGAVIGYDATSYFMNHVDRNLSKVTNRIGINKELLSGFNVKNTRTVLAPLDYNREVLCYEYECEKDVSTYYLYFNWETGEEENILKVIKTSDG